MDNCVDTPSVKHAFPTNGVSFKLPKKQKGVLPTTRVCFRGCLDHFVFDVRFIRVPFVERTEKIVKLV